MRRSSDELPQTRPQDFDFGWGTQKVEPTSFTPFQTRRHHTVSAGCSNNKKTLNNSLQERDVSPLKTQKETSFSVDQTPSSTSTTVMNTVPTVSTSSEISVSCNKNVLPIVPEPNSQVSNPGQSVILNTSPLSTFQIRRQTTGSFVIRKQDSIAEEPSPDCDEPTFDWSRSRSPSPNRSGGCNSNDSPDWRKRSLSPGPGIINNQLYTNVFIKRKNFQREISAAHSDVTETVSRKQYQDVATSPIPPALSCENNLQIKFDISSNSSLAKSNSSTIYRAYSLKKKKTSLAYKNGGSLVANGFLPYPIDTNNKKKFLLTTNIIQNDTCKHHLSITKQRSSSESAFQPTTLEAIPNGLQIRRCSASVLNPAKEEALLRKILGPSGLSWIPDKTDKNNNNNIKREQHSKKSLSLMISEDLENGKGGNDDSKTPLMKEQEKTGRLIHRQKLFISRRDTADWALIFAVIGIILMVIETELHVNDVYLKRSTASIVLRTIIMLSTIALIGTVIKFHVHEVELFMNANSAEDWRIALTFKRCSQIALELLICSICPLPLDISFTWDTLRHDGKAITRTTIQLDALLSIPMFFRLYWLFRVMLLHSKLFTDASSRSIAGLNRVAFNAKFILKTLMTLCPGIIMLVFTASLWIIAAWVLRLCEHHQTGDPTNYHAIKQQNYLNSLWMIAITFLSVGYGDIVPTTICGRGVAVVTGILGTCTSSMVVAVIARKLELSRAEKHVHNFMIDTKLTKELKHSAANVLRETWLIYKYRRLVDKIDPGKIRHHQRKFLMAIYALRKVKREQRQLAENSVSLGDVAKTTSNSYELIHDIHSTQDGLALRMTAVEHQLSDIQREIGQLADLFKTVVSNQNIVNIRRESGTDISPKRESVRKRNKYGDL